MANMCPLALPSVHCTDLIKYILQSHSVPTTLIVCSSRESFLEHLRATIRHTHPVNHSILSNGQSSDMQHPFLVPTIHLLTMSKTVTLAFTPTLPHFRAYLATFYSSSESSASTISTFRYDKPGVHAPTLAILGLVALHQSTSEYSAQGLSRSLASAVEAAGRARLRLLLAESRSPQENEKMLGLGDLLSEGQVINPWKEQVPLLSNSIRFGSEERSWAGRTIEVAKIVERWCRFVSFEEAGIM